ncbi:thioredoxin domain-containing protein [Marivirga sp. S37H4]|uniref:Thioredoxin domain-containing protein n=1 Tax=Marivirga aurantiaca TaxID=2802615 RepID=A0A935CBR0_9BACT|nr:thioredoxin domain-containing protein [Marivirga aurantiaca]MBK6267295.1 thioredoxin domain-containing protein [Marivirga aurantiaca]
MPKANKLIDESSPYLLQHAHNPVNWQAWNAESLKEAQQQDKPILLSIGYSACHWCHVMEHESFEDEQVAQIMNENFVCIKVDREERPDVDQIYMDAVQTMGLNGGWPLNVFLMPDQKPFYGGTYFPKKNWLSLLDNVALAYQNNREKLIESADNFAEALNSSDASRLQFGQSDLQGFSAKTLDDTFQQLEKFIDWDNGGTIGAPKFPMPAIWRFINRYTSLTDDKKAMEALELTLNSMARGGIYDQIGGGFSRYSVDGEWFAPHFEKMLYDNGQLISLYANAYRLTKNVYFRSIYKASISFIQRELMDEKGGFYSALDADSEGEEGKFYVWTYEEWENALGENSELMARFFNISAHGNWEKGQNIPYQNSSPEEFCKAGNHDLQEFLKKLEVSKKTLLAKRQERIRPGLDDKILCGWNALMLNGLCDAYKAEPKEEYLHLAKRNFEFIYSNMLYGSRLFRNYKNGKASIDAYLEDYALCIQAFISYAEISGNTDALQKAVDLADYTIENFFDKNEKLFFYTDNQSEKLIARKKELFDNVIPASNSVMAENLHWLSILSGKTQYMEISDDMLQQVQHFLKKEPRYMSNWASALLLKAYHSYDVVILGPEAKNMQQQLWADHHPNAIILAREKADSGLAVFKGKELLKEQTTIFVCQKNACQKPVYTVGEAIEQMRK